MLRESILPVSLFECNTKWLSSLSCEFAPIALLVFFCLLSSFESWKPAKKLSLKHLSLSYKTNIALFVFNSVILSVLSVSSLFVLAEKYSGSGLLRHVSNPVAQIILAFLMLDLLLYLWHKACHSFDCFWMFHRIHHNDRALNSSTAFRVHILEILITTLLKAVYIIALGVSTAITLGVEIIITFFVLFHHSNISFKGEKFLGYVIIVPSLHRVHHSPERQEHDSNYGAVLSIWDRLFGTLTELEPEKAGIKGRSPQDLINLIKFGFSVEPPTLVAATNPPVPLETMIAEAAYYKAEKRCFKPGYELYDWLEAKKEIIQLVYGNNFSRPV